MDSYMDGRELIPAEGKARMLGKPRRKGLCGWKDLVIIAGEKENGVQEEC